MSSSSSSIFKSNNFTFSRRLLVDPNSVPLLCNNVVSGVDLFLEGEILFCCWWSTLPIPSALLRNNSFCFSNFFTKSCNCFTSFLDSTFAAISVKKCRYSSLKSIQNRWTFDSYMTQSVYIGCHIFISCLSITHAHHFW